MGGVRALLAARVRRPGGDSRGRWRVQPLRRAWYPLQDSNSQPPDPKSGALSIELSGRTFILLNPTVAGRLNPMVAGRLRPMVAGRPGSPARPSVHLPGMNKKLGRHHG